MGQFVAAKAEVLSVAFNRNVPCLSSYYLPQFDMLDCDSSRALVYFSNTVGIGYCYYNLVTLVSVLIGYCDYFPNSQKPISVL